MKTRSSLTDDPDMVPATVNHQHIIVAQNRRGLAGLLVQTVRVYWSTIANTIPVFEIATHDGRDHDGDRRAEHPADAADADDSAGRHQRGGPGPPPRAHEDWPSPEFLGAAPSLSPHWLLNEGWPRRAGAFLS